MSLDFLMTPHRNKKGITEVYPKFVYVKSNDLMIRGRDFYAIWDAENGLWSTDEQTAIRLIDQELDKAAEELRKKLGEDVTVQYAWDTENGVIDRWHKFCQKQLPDSFHMLDEKLTFANTNVTKRDYVSKRLPYNLEPGDTSAYDEMMGVLYSPEERRKLEWAIGSIVNGDSKKIQKFVVLYGGPGTGKSTVLNIIEKMFEGYCETFDAKALGSANSSFALEAFRSNPLVAIQDDGDLSRIEDNTRLNSLVAHEKMVVNEKFKSTYSARFKSFLFMGTNKPVRITDAKSGLIRRLIDVSPTGEKLPLSDYIRLRSQIDFELGAIASHCLAVYNENPDFYEGYIPVTMLGASNDFYNFVADSYFTFKEQDSVSRKQAWEMYKTYNEEAKVAYPLNLRAFTEELKNYFRTYDERFTSEDGTRQRSYYRGFRTERFEETKPAKPRKSNSWLVFKEMPSLFDHIFADCPAQYGDEEGKPSYRWTGVATTLKDLDTHRLHYVLLPSNESPILVTVDLDIPGKDGKKNLEANMREAAKWPPTYAELSKSGSGIHLHYWYTGDPSKLAFVMPDNPHVEIKVPRGKASLRRALSQCNDLQIATISSGLPLKEVQKKVVNKDAVLTDRQLHATIIKVLNREYENIPSTKSGIDFISYLLEKQYASGEHYDVTTMRNAVLAFAANSTNNADYCIRAVSKMKFKSDDDPLPGVETGPGSKPIVFFDTEVFPNLFLVNWKYPGESSPVMRMINPDRKLLQDLIENSRLIGFNCRRYDNHILYAWAYMNYSNAQLYDLSQKIISTDKRARSKDCFFSNAYNLSYTDVYDFCAKKQSLKKWEIELGMHHKELGLPWDKPVPKALWVKVAEYCDNDVLATEAVFNDRRGDFIAREILADLAGLTVNDTTNTLTTRIIFGENRNPQDQFNYRDMGDESQAVGEQIPFIWEEFDAKGRPIFPGYKYGFGPEVIPDTLPELKAQYPKQRVSFYRNEVVGEGGYVYAEPGMYADVALLDIASMHPSSIIAEQLFGSYTKNFEDLKEARVAIKHKDIARAKTMLGGKLAKWLTDENNFDALSQALKIAINSVYGLTSASFDNPFHDRRNIDNIVAKRGALFMVNLKHAVQERGYVVAHIKTDSIKIPNADLDIIRFVQDYGRKYGYIFEHEGTYDRICLVNDAVYIAKYATLERCADLYGTEYVDSEKDILKDNKKHGGEWTATGTQFQIPYVFKTLFSHEPIEFEDLCETKSVTSAIYIDRSPEEAAVYINDPSYSSDGIDDLVLDNGHSLQFVGKVGLFTPVLEGCGGGELKRESQDKEGNTKYDSVTGAKGYLWLESEMVKLMEKQDHIDYSYYEALANEAEKDISQYGDFKSFVSDELFCVPPWSESDGPWNSTTAFDVR